MGYILSEVRELPSSANVLLFESMVLLRIVYEYYAFKLLRVQQLLFAIENCVGTQQCNGFVHHIHFYYNSTTYGFTQLFINLMNNRISLRKSGM